jgi:release factor glutamine methyltransferase
MHASDHDLTVGSCLSHARAAGLARLDGQLLLAHVLGRSRAWVIAHEDAQVNPERAARMQSLVAQRAEGEPLAYLVGAREFHGLRLRVTPGVLIPRPDTETLVDWALEILDGPLRDVDAPRIADLGTGSGAIALAIKASCPRALVYASDVSESALEVAMENGERNGLAVIWRRGHWWQAIDDLEPMHMVLSNPPYVAAGDPGLAELRREPALALVPTGDRGDGLGDLERLARGAVRHMRDGGKLLLEHGSDQGAPVAKLLREAGFGDISMRRDLAGHPRVTGGTARNAAPK